MYGTALRACDVGRVEDHGLSLHVHMHAADPGHRQQVCRMVDGGCSESRSSFMAHLRGELAARAGWPAAEEPLTLKACLPYTQSGPMEVVGFEYPIR